MFLYNTYHALPLYYLYTVQSYQSGKMWFLFFSSGSHPLTGLIDSPSWALVSWAIFHLPCKATRCQQTHDLMRSRPWSQATVWPPLRGLHARLRWLQAWTSVWQPFGNRQLSCAAMISSSSKPQLFRSTCKAPPGWSLEVKKKKKAPGWFCIQEKYTEYTDMPSTVLNRLVQLSSLYNMMWYGSPC